MKSFWEDAEDKKRSLMMGDIVPLELAAIRTRSYRHQGDHHDTLP
jgi:hypothetical protein